MNCALEKERLKCFISIQNYKETFCKKTYHPYLSVTQSSGLGNPVDNTETDQHDPGAQIINTLEIPASVSL